MLRDLDSYILPYLPLATKLGQGYIFTGVCDFVHRGGVPGPEGVPGLGSAWSGMALVRGVAGGDPPGTATAAGGTHPTGMQSCLLFFCTIGSLVERIRSCFNAGEFPWNIHVKYPVTNTNKQIKNLSKEFLNFQFTVVDFTCYVWRISTNLAPRDCVQ